MGALWLYPFVISSPFEESFFFFSDWPFFSHSGRKISRTAAQAIGYKEFLPYFAGEKTIDEVREEIKLATRHYAKRQLIWFRKDKVSHRLVPDKDGEVRNTSDIADEAVSRFFG